MRFLQHMVAALGLSVVSVLAAASPASPVSGTDFRTLDKAQPVESGKKIEVTEFFWYDCPHCNAWDPALSEWVKKQGERIAFKRVPVYFRENFLPEQKLYYALEALGKVEEFHKKIFYAVHVERQRLLTDEAIVDFVTKQGIDKAKFVEAYNSFGVQTKVRRAEQLQEAYKIDGVPTVAVDGRYETSPAIVGESSPTKDLPETGQQAAAIQVLDWLVAKVAKERK
jgi:thiol:disulfide interchange protein DsbA